LALALIERYIERELEMFEALFDRARELHDDPLQQFLVGLKLFAELMADLPEGHPGCLIATSCYQEQLFDQRIQELNQSALLAWRQRFRDQFKKIAAIYPLQDSVELDALADMVSSTVEGGIIMSKAMKTPSILPEQILLLRSYIKLLFMPKMPDLNN
ncbi:MAG: TetR/AcrR family transcriptional regulator, partial [Rhizobiaceae bacterium]